MASILSNSIYQHSAETIKDSSVAQQACVNEDQEQRRRQLDSQGELIKQSTAKEVAHIVDSFGGNVHLKHVAYEAPKEPLLQQAQSAATGLLQSALATGKSIIDSATAATAAATERVSEITKDAAATATIIGQQIGHDAAVLVKDATKNAAEYVSHAAHDAAHAAQDAAHQAAVIASNVKDTTAHAAVQAAEVVSQKTKEIAEGATNKALEIADNISHFTTLVGVLAQEENERARRLVSGDEARAAANAFRVSGLIRDLGASFYKQESINLNYATKILEEAERRYRINSAKSALAESNAHLVGKLVNNNMQNFMPRYQWARTHIGDIEEKERTRRLNDADETYAIMNALNTSNLIHDLDVAFYRQSGVNGSYATTLLEENERRNRIREDKLLHAEDSAHLLMDVVANNMEKFNYTTRHAARFATEFANLVSRETLRVASSFASVTQDLAKNTAQRVKEAASELTHFSAVMYVVALEERERARRMSDSNEFNAIINAWRQSQLIRDLPSLYRSSSIARFPIALLEDQERRWRITSVVPTASKKINEIVLANQSKFEARNHSRLNINAPAFVPHQPLMSKAEPAPIQRSSFAAGAQL